MMQILSDVYDTREGERKVEKWKGNGEGEGEMEIDGMRWLKLRGSCHCLLPGRISGVSGRRQLPTPTLDRPTRLPDSNQASLKIRTLVKKYLKYSACGAARCGLTP